MRSPLTLEEIERRLLEGARRAADAGDQEWQRIQGRSRAVLGARTLAPSTVFVNDDPVLRHLK